MSELRQNGRNGQSGQNGATPDHNTDTDETRPTPFGMVQIGGASVGDDATPPEEVVARLQQAAEAATEPGSQADAYTELGKYHARRGAIDDACAAFRLALHHNPHQADALAHLFFLGRTA